MSTLTRQRSTYDRGFHGTTTLVFAGEVTRRFSNDKRKGVPQTVLKRKEVHSRKPEALSGCSVYLATTASALAAHVHAYAG